MAELDIKGFVTPEQQFAGLYKLAEDMTAQKVAKAKADEAAKANKAALTKLAENKFSSKDYLSGTVADPNITNKLSNGLQQVYTFIAENPGATESHIQLFANPIIRQVAQDSEKSKELKRQLETGKEKIKGMKGIDLDKFEKSFQQRAWGIQDGKVPDNLDNVDITHNYIDDVLNNDDIYNAEAIRESIKNAKPIEYSYSQTSRNKAGVQKATLYDAKSQPFYQPLTDASGKPTGDFEPKHETFTDNDAVVMHEWMGDDGQKVNAPIKLLDKDAFEQIFSPANNPAAAAYLRNEVKKQMQGKAPLNSSQAEALSRAIAYDLVRDNMTEPASIKLKEEQKQPIVKNVTNVSVGGAGGVARDIYTPAMNIYKKLQERKDKVPELVNQGKTNEEISKIIGLAPSAVEASRQGRNKASLPLNTKGLDAAFVNSVVETVNAGGGLGSEEDVLGGTKTKKYDRTNLGVQLNDDGQWEVYSAEKDKPSELITTIDAATLGYKVQPNAKGKAQLAIEEKANNKLKSAPSIKSYDNATQKKISSFMGKNKLSENDAIKILIANGLIKKP